MSDEPSCSNDLDPQLPRCAWMLACSVSRKDASPQSSASARRIPGRILSGNGVHRFRNHCSTSPEYAEDTTPCPFDWIKTQTIISTEDPYKTTVNKSISIPLLSITHPTPFAYRGGCLARLMKPGSTLPPSMSLSDIHEHQSSLFPTFRHSS